MVLLSDELFFSWCLDAQADRDVKTKKCYWYTRSEAQRGLRLDVPEEHKKAFASKMITCGKRYHRAKLVVISFFATVEYKNLAPGTERDIFQRVQLGMTLTAAGM